MCAAAGGCLLVLLVGGAAGAQELQVDGEIESTGGGLEFPDASVQASAVGDYAGEVVVATSGGDFSSIQAAIDSITDESTTDRYLIRVAPGIYDEQVTMASFIDVAGSGPATTIRSAGFATAFDGTVVCAGDAELRDITVVNTGADQYATGIYCTAAATFSNVVVESSDGTGFTNGVFAGQAFVRMRRVGVEVSAGSGVTTALTLSTNSGSEIVDSAITSIGGGFNTAVAILDGSHLISATTIDASGGSTDNTGVFAAGEDVELAGVTVDVSGDNAVNVALAPQLCNVTVRRSVLEASGGTDSYAVRQNGGTGPFDVLIHLSRLAGATNTVSATTTFETRIAFSQLDGGSVAGGSVVCAGNYDENFDPFASTCP